jgi:hypothetical protein
VTSGTYRAEACAHTLVLNVPVEHVDAVRQDLKRSLLTVMDDFRIAEKNGDPTDMGCCLGRIKQLADLMEGVGVVAGSTAQLVGDRSLLLDYLKDMVADYGQWAAELLDDGALEQPVDPQELDRVLAGLAAGEALLDQAQLATGRGEAQAA